MRNYGVLEEELEEIGLRKVLFVTWYCTLYGDCTVDEKARNCRDCEYSICVFDQVPQQIVAV